MTEKKARKTTKAKVAGNKVALLLADPSIESVSVVKGDEGYLLRVNYAYSGKSEEMMV